MNYTEKQMIEVADTIDKLFLDSFNGVPVRVDFSLEGDRHYVAVSKELWERIKDNNKDTGI